LEVLDTAELDLETLGERREEAEKALAAAASALTKKRRSGAGTLSAAVQGLLPGLGMPDGRFRVDVRPAEEVTGSGGDQVNFLVQLNPGMDARPLTRVASGGELSRIMLALKVVLAGHDAIPTLVFDEVDQGIGGEVAAMVAEALDRVAQTQQVLVITHLPLIAARANHHVSVAKAPKEGVATADVAVLHAEHRVQEVARMLGDASDPVAVQHAGELLRRAGTAGGG
jgi:DNA repair protein RecN (Recombination protein N)